MHYLRLRPHHPSNTFLGLKVPDSILQKTISFLFSLWAPSKTDFEFSSLEILQVFFLLLFVFDLFFWFVLCFLFFVVFCFFIVVFLLIVFLILIFYSIPYLFNHLQQ